MFSMLRLPVAGFAAIALLDKGYGAEVALGETLFTVPDGFTVERVAGPAQVVAQKDRGCAGRKQERLGRQSHSRETEDGPILGSQNTQER